MRHARAAIGGAIILGAGALLLRPGGADAALWTTSVGSGPTVLAVDARTGRAFVLNEGSGARTSGGGIVEGTISVLDTRTGAVVRSVPGGTDPRDVVVDTMTSRAFVLNTYMHNGGQGTVTVLDARSGALVRTTRVAGALQALALDERTHRVYVVADNSARVSVLDARSGRLLRIERVGDLRDAGPHADVGVRRGRAFAGGLQGAAFEVLDTPGGPRLRSFPAPPYGGSVVLSARTSRAFIFGPYSAWVRDTATGQLLRTFRLVPFFTLGDAVVDEWTERVFVATPVWDNNGNPTNGGQLSVLDARTGAVRGSIRTPWPGRMAVDEQTGRILATYLAPRQSDGTFAGVGQVRVLDGRDGSILHSIPLGASPDAVAVVAGRAFVLDSGGTTHDLDRWAWLPRPLRALLPSSWFPGAGTRAIPASVSALNVSR